jgi:hypothetical protein
MQSGTVLVGAARPSHAALQASAGKDYMVTLPGVSGPLGYFDPLGFSESPTFTVSEAKRFRESELTHGRVAMLAALGWLVAEEFHVRGCPARRGAARRVPQILCPPNRFGRLPAPLDSPSSAARSAARLSATSR